MSALFLGVISRIHDFQQGSFAPIAPKTALKDTLLVRPSSHFQNERGITPLGIAVGFNRVAVVELLLSFGADVMVRDPKDNTTLHYAAGEILGGVSRCTSRFLF